MAERKYEDIAGAGLIRVTTQADVRRSQTLKRDVAPLEGTNMSLFNSVIPAFWSENGLSPSQQWWPADGKLADRVWVASRCIQLNAQQVASMPLRFEGVTEPAWLSAPDPHWFPNGISDAIFAIVAQLYGWGWSLLYVTSRYSDGYPRTWTVLDSRFASVEVLDGARVYKFGEATLDPADVVQIDRNPGMGLKGSSALSAYAQLAWGSLAAGNQAMSVANGGVPTAVLKSQRKLDATQAQALQTQWMAALARRNGAPPVLPPEIDFEPLSYNPKDLALLETQQWSVGALATAFGVPSVLLNQALQGGLTYQNPAALGEMWWRFELRPTAKRVADALTAQMLPAGQWVWFDAADTFLPLDANSEEDDPQASVVAKASPTQQTGRPLTAIGGGG